MFHLYSTWNFFIVLIALFAQLLLRNTCIPACVAVISTLMVGITGSAIVAMSKTHTTRQVHMHLLLHVIPMVLTILLLISWRKVVATVPTVSDVFVAVGAIVVAMTVYALVPHKSLCGTSKFENVYHMSALLGAVVIVSALSLSTCMLRLM